MMTNLDLKPLYFLTGMALGMITTLLVAPRTGPAYLALARGKEAGDVARDAADVLRRSKRLKRPLRDR